MGARSSGSKRITKRTVDALRPGEVVWDTGIRGFGVRRRSTEAKFYLVKYRFAGRQRWFTIGQHGAPWTAEQARNEATRLLGEVAGGRAQLALAHLHPVAIAIFVGALLAAIMSSADSALLAAASVFSTNVLPLFKPESSDRLRLLVTRMAIPVFGSIAVYVALKVQVVYNLILDANSVILVCVTVPFIVGVWWKRANRTGALASMAMGFLTWFLAIVYAPGFPGDLLGLLVGLITMLIVTTLTQKTDPPKPVLDSNGQEIELKNRLGTLPLFRRVM